MIPTLLLAGLVVGAFVHDGASLRRGFLAGLGMSILWGVGVGVANGGLRTFFGGTALALANVLVAVVTTTTRSLVRHTVAGTRPPTR